MHVDANGATGADNPAPPARHRAKKDNADDDNNFGGLDASLEVTAAAGSEWRKLMNLMMQLRKVCNRCGLAEGLMQSEAVQLPRNCKLVAEVLARTCVRIARAFLGLEIV